MAFEAFIDTSAYYAVLDRNDQWHEQCKERFEKLARAGAKFVTTDYILDETASLLQARGLGYLASPWLETLSTKKSLAIIWMNQTRFDEVRQFFAKHSDKDWSFTDCFSFVVMRERGIQKALTNDHHFRQAGFEPLLGE
jgi:predicted nucleic acid-binding protein